MSGLQKSEFELILRVFSFKTYFNDVFDYTDDFLYSYFENLKKNSKYPKYDSEKLIVDLKVALSLLIKDGFVYKFPHKSLQEYFTAFFIKEDLTIHQKKIIYDKIWNDALHNKTGRHLNINFLNLCDELDKINFRKLFLIKRLKEYLNKIDNSTPHIYLPPELVPVVKLI